MKPAPSTTINGKFIASMSGIKFMKESFNQCSRHCLDANSYSSSVSLPFGLILYRCTGGTCRPESHKIHKEPTVLIDDVNVRFRASEKGVIVQATLFETRSGFGSGVVELFLRVAGRCPKVRKNSNP